MSRPTLSWIAHALAAAALAACANPRTPVDSGAHQQLKVPQPSPASAEARATSEEVLSSGGEIDLSQLPAATVERANGALTDWGLAEVPGDSRLQAALALADANARAELLGAVRVGIASSSTVTSSASTSGASSAAGGREIESQEVTERSAQVANGLLPALPPALHGWRKVRRNGEVILLVCARLTAREEALLAALAGALKDRPDPAAQARAVLEQLGKGHRLGAE